MGEYATRLDTGENIKIGTCEDLYYLRWDQVDMVRGDGINLRSAEALAEYRFRFPFPNEDHIAPGNFDNHDYGIPVHGAKVPDGVEHSIVQFVATAGYNLCLPCPEGVKDGYSPGMSTTVNGIKVHRNGFNGGVKVVQQRWWNGELVTVCKCGACGVKYRLETSEMVLPVVEYFVREADEADERDGMGAGRFSRQMAERILHPEAYWNRASA